jgi:hypothetical protein
VFCQARRHIGASQGGEGVSVSRKGGGAVRYWWVADGEVAHETKGWCVLKVLSTLNGKDKEDGSTGFSSVNATFRLDRTHESFGLQVRASK